MIVVAGGTLIDLVPAPRAGDDGSAPLLPVPGGGPYNAVNCRFGKNDEDREKYCNALETEPMTETAKNCLIRMGVGGAAALIAGKVNKKVAREITVNTVASGASGCLTALLT